MFYRIVSSFLLACAALLLQTNSMHAADGTTYTMHVQGMHCAGCASKVTRNLQAVQGVQRAEVDAEKALAVISAGPDQAPSPRALWEAVEKAGYKPIKLIGPGGMFTTKPKS